MNLKIVAYLMIILLCKIHGNEYSTKLHHDNQKIEHINSLYKLSESGSSQAQYQLAMLLLRGEGVVKDPKKGAELLYLSAKKGYHKSVFQLGQMFLIGEVFEKNLSSAVHFFEIASKMGNSDAQYELGNIYYSKKNYSKAILNLKKSSSKNNDKALFLLGKMYFEGKGLIVEDYLKAVEFYTRSAEIGNADALYELGRIYYHPFQVVEYEKIIPTDTRKAFLYYKKASELGNFEAKRRLAEMYYSGVGTEKNFKEAFNLYNECHDYYIGNWNSRYKYILAQMYSYGLGVKKDIQFAFKLYNEIIEVERADYKDLAYIELAFLFKGNNGIKEDLEKSMQYLNSVPFNRLSLHASQYFRGKLHVEQDFKKADFIYSFLESKDELDPNASYNYAMMFFNGDYVNKNVWKATSLFKKSADEKMSGSQYKLARSYQEGLGIEKDLSKAIDLFILAGEQGVYESQIELGLLTFSTSDIHNSINYSFELYKHLSTQGNPYASYFLGRMYYYGIGTEVNILEATNNYKLAQEQGLEEFISNAKSLYDTDYDKILNYRLKMLKILTDEGYSFAQYLLGQLYERGLGVEKDIHKAFSLYVLSANQNDPVGQYLLARLYGNSKFPGESIDEHYYKSFYYYDLAVKNGNIDAISALASCYVEGKGVKRDIDKGIELYEYSIEKGDVFTSYSLGVLYWRLNGEKRDLKKAAILIETAMKSGYYHAKDLLESLGLNKYLDKS